MGTPFLAGTGINLSLNSATKQLTIAKGTSAQYGFLAYKSANSTNATGDGTGFTVICDTEVFDLSNNFNTTNGIFTAPVNGYYLFGGAVKASNLSSTMSYINQRLFTSMVSFPNRVPQKHWSSSGPSIEGTTGQIYMYLDAADTIQIDYYIFNGGKTATVEGNSSVTTYFYGALLQ